MASIDPSEILLVDTDGLPVRFGDMSGDPLVVVFVRFFGSPSCQAFLTEVGDAVAARRFPPSARVVAIGGTSDENARSLRYDHGVRTPMLLDTEHRVRSLAEVGTLGPRLLDPRGASRYAAAVRCGNRPRRPTRDVTRAPGVAIFDRDRNVAWSYEGSFVGDFPDLDQLLEQVVTTAAAPS